MPVRTWFRPPVFASYSATSAAGGKGDDRVFADDRIARDRLPQPFAYRSRCSEICIGQDYAEFLSTYPADQIALA